MSGQVGDELGTGRGRLPSQRQITRHVVAWGLIGAVVALATIFLVGLLTDMDEIKRLTAEAGIWGPPVFITLQAVQVIIFPIPGHVTGVAAGYLFGPVLGTLYSTVGGTLGFTAVFLLARKLGRPFVEKLLSKKQLDSLDYFCHQNGPAAFFVVFLLPIFPDDVIGYLAGLTRIPVAALVVTVLVGRFPFYLALALVGAGVAHSNILLLTSVSVVIAVVVAFSLWKRPRIEEMLRGPPPVGQTKRLGAPTQSS